MPLRAINPITIKYHDPRVCASNDNLVFQPTPTLDLICPHCHDVTSMPLFDGLHYDRKEAEQACNYIKGMRDYFKKLTEGKLDVVEEYNAFLLSNLRVEIEIEQMTNPRNDK
jgi:hypothetical protein